jgi:hypothetical protein
VGIHLNNTYYFIVPTPNLDEKLIALSDNTTIDSGRYNMDRSQCLVKWTGDIKAAPAALMAFHYMDHKTTILFVQGPDWKTVSYDE